MNGNAPSGTGLLPLSSAGKIQQMTASSLDLHQYGEMIPASD
jgi:hypothetical protein